ncbi:MAG: hypothetical protein WBA61_00085 [Aequorivita sp.]
MKKRILAISLLFVLFAPVATIYLYLQYEKATLKREIKWRMIAEMDHNELVLMKFSKEDIKTKLKWEHSKEFEYNGEMYDIVDIEVKGDSIFYRCWWDYEETALNKKLNKIVASAFNKDQTNRDTQNNLYTYLRSFFFTEQSEWKSIALPNVEFIYCSSLHNEIFKSLHLSPPTPPPKLR